MFENNLKTVDSRKLKFFGHTFIRRLCFYVCILCNWPNCFFMFPLLSLMAFRNCNWMFLCFYAIPKHGFVSQANGKPDTILRNIYKRERVQKQFLNNCQVILPYMSYANVLNRYCSETFPKHFEQFLRNVNILSIIT